MNDKQIFWIRSITTVSIAESSGANVINKIEFCT